MVSLQNFLQLDDYNGVPLAAGKIYVYHQGRTELAEIYSDINGETPIANPAVLDDLGMQEIYVSNVYNYSVVVTDPYNNELFTRDIYPNGVDGDGNNRLYEGLDPICVNNEKLVISAKKATLSVQDPLYFVEDSQSAVCIGLQESAYSGLPYVENSAIGYGMAGNISSISGLGFYALSANSAALANSASIAASAENAGLVTDGWETGSDGRITAYNGTAFSAGKVYSGISPVYVNNESDLIGVSSKDFLANSPLYFTEYSDRVELSISGLPPTPGLMYESGFNYESGKITGYNGSGISAGKVYSGIDPVHVDNVNDTISLDSATLGVQAPLYFVEDSESATIIGLNNAQIQIDIPESANWNEAYSTVANNSADWNNKLDADIYAEDSGNFYTNDNPSGFITGVDLTDYATKDFVNDNVASSISGKLDIATYSSESGNFLTAHQSLPESADWNSAASTVSAGYTLWNASYGTLTANSANWDSTYTTVSNNSASWTGGNTGKYISAQGFDQKIRGAGSNNAKYISFYEESLGSTANPAIFLNGQFGTAYYKENELKLGRSNHTIAFNIGGSGPSISACAAGAINSRMYIYNGTKSATISQTGFNLKNSTANENVTIASIQNWNSTYNTVSNNSGSWNIATCNSYDNPGWETEGITTGNPLGFKINPSVAYDDVRIVASRLITRKIGQMYELDLSLAFSGNPKSQYGYYNNFATLDSGHFACPFTAQSQDDWNNVGGNMSYVGIWGTEAHYTTFDPYNKSATQVINLKTYVFNS